MAGRPVLTLILAGMLLGWQTQAAHGQQLGGMNFVALFSALDANGDGRIERTEVPESGRDAFDRLVRLADRDHDTRIDRDEYQRFLERARESQRQAAPTPRARFEQRDTNHDGKLSRAEFPGDTTTFDRIDADHDGFVSLDEARTFLQSNRTPQKPTFDPPKPPK